jgi:hypothetical protein
MQSTGKTLRSSSGCTRGEWRLYLVADSVVPTFQKCSFDTIWEDLVEKAENTCYDDGRLSQTFFRVYLLATFRVYLSAHSLNDQQAPLRK